MIKQFKGLTRLTRISMLLFFFFSIDKAVGLLRQVIIARQFGLSKALDAFNVANNIPDLLYALISGGALALAFIPVLTATLTQEGRDEAWKLFSRVANLVFLVTGALAIIVAIIAGPLVRSQFGVAPGFGVAEQNTVIELMRLNLIATLIFSISGLVMSGLQANNHFLFPAMAPIFYNLGQIFGALVLSPAKGYAVAGITLPAFGMGVHGLVLGVILGSALHLGIQIPALVRYGFRWMPSLGLRTESVKRVLLLMGPRILTVFSVQVIFLVRDNLASRLTAGAVTSLTYGWMLQQVPETLIGTAIGTALLPTLSELAARNEQAIFHETIQRAVRVLVAVTLPIAVILGVGLGPLLAVVFKFGPEGTQVLLWTTRGFLAGLIGHSLMEVASRAFYSHQDARTPLIASGVNMLVYIGLGTLLYRPLGPAGISLTDSICFTTQALVLLALMSRRLGRRLDLGGVLWRALAGALAGGAVVWGLQSLALVQRNALLGGVFSLAVGMLVALPFIWKEVRLLLKL